MKPVNILQAVEKVYKLFSKRLDRDSDIHQDAFKTLTIERAEKGPAHIDGEPIVLGKSIAVRCVPQSLQILVPKS
jgi:diacylglycerol kinase (ATP)